MGSLFSRALRRPDGPVLGTKVEVEVEAFSETPDSPGAPPAPLSPVHHPPHVCATPPSNTAEQA